MCNELHRPYIYVWLLLPNGHPNEAKVDEPNVHHYHSNPTNDQRRHFNIFAILLLKYAEFTCVVPWMRSLYTK